MAEPAYRQFATRLRDAILTGEYPDGKNLPAITKLAETYGVSISVAERAVRQLREEGLVIGKPGSGVKVQLMYERIPRVSPGRLARSHWAAGHAIQDHDTGDRWRAADDGRIGECPAPDWVAAPFGIAAGEPVVFRTRRYVVDDRPTQLATSYFPVELARGTRIMHTDTGPGGVYARLDERGFGPDRYTEKLIARAPTAEEVERLGLPRRSDHVIQVTRTAWCGARCVEVNRMVLDAAVYELEYNFSA